MARVERKNISGRLFVRSKPENKKVKKQCVEVWLLIEYSKNQASFCLFFNPFFLFALQRCPPIFLELTTNWFIKEMALNVPLKHTKKHGAYLYR